MCRTLSRVLLVHLLLLLLPLHLLLPLLLRLQLLCLLLQPPFTLLSLLSPKSLFLNPLLFTKSHLSVHLLLAVSLSVCIPGVILLSPPVLRLLLHPLLLQLPVKLLLFCFPLGFSPLVLCVDVLHPLLLHLGGLLLVPHVLRLPPLLLLGRFLPSLLLALLCH